jgi:hypothetical protein
MTVQEIERAIETLSLSEAEEIRDWIALHAGPQPIDGLIERGVSAGRFEGLVAEALGDEKDGRLDPVRAPAKEAGKPIGPRINTDERG